MWRPEGFDAVIIGRKRLGKKTCKELEQIMGDAGLEAHLSVIGEANADAMLEALRKHPIIVSGIKRRQGINPSKGVLVYIPNEEI